MLKILLVYIRAREGATAIEYGLIACGIALAIVGVVFVFGDSLQQVFATMPAALDAADNEIETSR